MPVKAALDRGQADAGAGELGGVMEPLKGPKQHSRAVRIEADSVVAHKVKGAVVLLRPAEFDPRRRLPAGELPRVAQQVREHDAHQVGIRRSDQRDRVTHRLPDQVHTDGAAYAIKC